jgi:hypothetical protein
MIDECRLSAKITEGNSTLLNASMKNWGNAVLRMDARLCGTQAEKFEFKVGFATCQ